MPRQNIAAAAAGGDAASSPKLKLSEAQAGQVVTFINEIFTTVREGKTDTVKDSLEKLKKLGGGGMWLAYDIEMRTRLVANYTSEIDNFTADLRAVYGNTSKPGHINVLAGEGKFALLRKQEASDLASLLVQDKAKFESKAISSSLSFAEFPINDEDFAHANEMLTFLGKDTYNNSEIAKLVEWDKNIKNAGDQSAKVVLASDTALGAGTALGANAALEGSDAMLQGTESANKILEQATAQNLKSILHTAEVPGPASFAGDSDPSEYRAAASNLLAKLKQRPDNIQVGGDLLDSVAKVKSLEAAKLAGPRLLRGNSFTALSPNTDANVGALSVVELFSTMNSQAAEEVRAAGNTAAAAIERDAAAEPVCKLRDTPARFARMEAELQERRRDLQTRELALIKRQAEADEKVVKRRAALQDEYAKLRTDLEQRYAGCDPCDREAEVDEAAGDVEKQCEDLAAARAEFEAEVAATQQRWKDLESKTAGFKQRQAALEAEKAALALRKSDVDAREADLVKRTKEAESKLKRAAAVDMAKVAEFEKKIAERQKELGDLEVAADDLRMQRDLLAEEIEQQQAGIDLVAAKEKLAAVEALHAELVARNKRLEATNQRIEDINCTTGATGACGDGRVNENGEWVTGTDFGIGSEPELADLGTVLSPMQSPPATSLGGTTLLANLKNVEPNMVFFLGTGATNYKWSVVGFYNSVDDVFVYTELDNNNPVQTDATNLASKFKIGAKVAPLQQMPAKFLNAVTQNPAHLDLYRKLDRNQSSDSFTKLGLDKSTYARLDKD
jgi:hypothetical protein